MTAPDTKNPTSEIKVLISDPVDPQSAEIFRSRGFIADLNPGLAPEELLRVIPGYDALIVRSQTKVSAAVIAAGTRLKVIGRAGAGVDNIDLNAASRSGIIVMNTPGGNTISTAEHTISMMLSSARNIPQADKSIKAGEWNRKKYVGVELFEKTLGVLGLGKVGREVALRCKAFEMKVIAYDPFLSTEAAREMSIEAVTVEELLLRADFITVHTPLTPETKGLLNRESLKTCKRGVRIVNCARGGIVDEAALLEALESGQVGGAALDVFSVEPPGDIPLLHHPNVIATPHLGASTEEAQEKVAIQIAHQVCDMLSGRGITGGVNADVVNAAMRTELRPFLTLAEKLGKLVGHLMIGKMTALSMTTQGAILHDAGKVLTASFLKGLLGTRLSEPLNLLNASLIAAERGIAIDLHHDGDGDAQSGSIAVAYRTEKETRSFGGTVFGNKHIRLVNVDGFHFEVNPEGHLLFYSNLDKPGRIAAVSTILAHAGINIAGMSLGRYGLGDAALAVMSVDSIIPDDIIEKIAAVEGMLSVRMVTL